MAGKLRVRKSSGANEDLFEIWDYINAESPAAATKVIRRLDAMFQKLSHYPEIGRLRPELAPGLRSFPIGSHVVFYRCDHDTLTIVRVLSGQRDVGPTLFES